MSNSNRYLNKLEAEEVMLMRSQFKLPANVISNDMRALWLANLDAGVRAVARQIIQDANWQIFVVNQRRGRCYYKSRTITIPMWAVLQDKSKQGYSTWYTAHELSHVFTPGADHGPEFMAKLIEICPTSCIEYELGYKPRNAAQAGIGQIGLMDI